MDILVPTTELIKKGSLLRHFKGEIYQVDFLATDANNDSLYQGEDMIVIYHNIKNVDKKFTRPLSQFLELVGSRPDNVTNQNFRFMVLRLCVVD